ncbi:cupin domain-containing protein [Flagellimonas flava]|uniref:AraC-like ligand binding domain-containing protein n=1 Tax=Flagellimonas flava TaxID=570519 RepID=A0A1M5K5D4_9FLAO|nr:cupin domain-containing protein [Allomuricauda flava]SHG47995.1 AraC-like ligand binding domain-containing protein [Allomuricauda flava]
MILNNIWEGFPKKSKGPSVTMLLDTRTSKELKIEFTKDEMLKEHRTPFPIMIEIFEGEISFTAEGRTHHLERGHIISLEANVPHSLLAVQNSIVRLTLSKRDTIERVKKIDNK